MSMTFTEVLSLHDITVPDETIADITVPILAGPQRQGDVLIIPRPKLGKAELDGFTTIERAGVQVVRGEATGNTHLLHAEGPARWKAHTSTAAGDLLLGTLQVDEGATAYLIHTDEHSANGIAPGCYLLHGKREQADEIRRVQD